MISVPQPTVEKPLTVVDYIAALYGCESVREIAAFCARVPDHICEDERFSTGVAMHLRVIAERRKVRR